ncbi:MAG: zf-HC2 domain-containing protein [Polyangiaceae bacterium]|nr:zf-HC2 domain-containing protein [Polyangiaceae bacterium]
MKARELPAENRLVAGLLCTQVLAQLSAYLDGELSEAEVEQIRSHVQGCTTCEEFGGRFATAVQKLREVEEEVAPDTDDRLFAALGLSR